MSDKDPRIVRLAGEAQYAAQAYDAGLTVATDRSTCMAVISISTVTPCVIDRDMQITAHCHLSLEQLDEHLRDLLATRADLLKLRGLT